VIGTGSPRIALSAATDAGGRLAGETLPWLAVFAVAVVVLWLAAVWLKRRISGGTSSGGGFDSEELERLRRDGALTEEQHRAIARTMARRAAGLGEPPPATRTGDSDKGGSQERSG